MSILKEYKEPKDLLEKLLREGKRTWTSKDIQEKVDHFFNFCVTSLSLRDWCLAYLNLDGAEKSDFYNIHSQNEWLNYCGSIANLSKHFKLLEGRKSSVSSVDSKISRHMLLGIGDDGKMTEITQAMRVSFDIKNSDGNVKGLMEVLSGCVSQWEQVFTDYNIPAPDSDLKYRMFIEYL
ncbi:hypothetical protein [Psychrobacter sp. SWN149]|uniref:hypothetical protein n=1 Tax=Psychrobacter sp. SWN149 TaxID=2792057 RepID=UPI0018CCA430|nr:hypothetical protein [Psychrobacter sp. SWN149]MBH0005594.1 hypothetical protein [Psychrobacter sp. SWN149]